MITIEIGLFTSFASCFFINVQWRSDLDYIVDLVWEGHGDLFGFEHSVKANGFNVLLIRDFQDMPRAIELVEPYFVYLTSIGSLTTTK
jgi:hypothetical protein